MPFPPAVLDRLAAANEILVETYNVDRNDGRTRRRIIWVVVDTGDVFVRSVRGHKGRWYRDLRVESKGWLHPRDDVTLRVAFRAVPVEAPADLDRASTAISAKYEGRPGYEPMLRPEAVAATLRLEPLPPADRAAG